MFIYSLNYLRLVYRLFSLDQAGVGVSCCDRDPLRQLQGGGGPQHPLKSSTFPFIFNFPFRLFLFLILNEEQSGSKDQLPPKVRISLWVGFTPNPQSWFKYKTVQKKKDQHQKSMLLEYRLSRLCQKKVRSRPRI